MRVRKGHSSSSDSQERTRMRKQMVKDASDFPSGSENENTQGDEALDDRDSNEENSSSLLSQPLTKGRTRRENAKSKAMTEEEMMDLALRLSEQEASVNALRLQKEEEAVRKAIQESMASESQSQSLIDGAEDSLCSRRKLLYSKEKPLSAIDQGTSEDGITIETDMYPGAKETGGDSNNRLKKRKKKEGSPLLEMPDLSQTQNIFSQASSCSSEPLELILDSQLSPDLTQIDDHQLGKSPVFPLTGCRAEVHVPRLSQSLVKTCSTSGFVLCSQDSITPPPQVSLPAQPNSPTFPNDPKLPSHLTVSKSPVFSETDQGEDEETQLSPECFKSPVFGGNPPREASPSACSRPQDNGCNSGITFSSQESLISSVTSTSCQPKSPVFLKSPGLPKRSENCKSPVVLEIDGGQTKPGRSSCTRPVFDRTEQQQNTDLAVQEISASPSEAEVTGSDDEGNSTVNRSLSGSRRQDSKTDHNLDVAFINKMSESDDAEEPKEKSQNWASVEMELTSDMALLLSDEDDDVTPVGSPSPVFPEEGPVHRADSQAVPPSLNHKSEACPEVNGSNCSPPSSPTPADRQQPSTTERPTRPFSGESAPPVESAGRPTVHYYWGVPFCPRGLDPDEYTQVIVAQMEVYEKSLKQAQRLLLRKAEWGEAVLPQPEKSPSPEPPSPESPQPAPRRLGLRRRSRKLREAADDPPADGEEEEEEEEDGQKDEREEERESTKEEEEEEKKKKNEGDEEGQVDIDDCEVCPETQLSDDDRTQDLMIDVEAGAELQPKSPERPEVEMILQKDSPAVDEQQDEDMEVDVEAQGDRLTKRNIPVTSSDSGSQNVKKEEVEEERGDQDVEEISHRRLQRSASPELELTTVPQSPESKVDCPICQGSFPVTEIEMHAAYCDGEVKVMDQGKPAGDCFQVSLKPRRKRSRRSMITEETDSPSNTGKNQERCYICQKAVPLGDYVRHTELCFQRQASSSAGKGNLLSALEQTESRDSEAGPSGSKLQRGPIREVIDLRDDDDDDEEEATTSVSALGISNSPIRSFTPISEATDCLIDFKKQRTKKLSQRRR